MNHIIDVLTLSVVVNHQGGKSSDLGNFCPTSMPVPVSFRTCSFLVTCVPGMTLVESTIGGAAWSRSYSV